MKNEEADGITVQIELSGVTLAMLDGMAATVERLEEEAPREFEDDPFLAAHMKRAANWLCLVHREASRELSDSLAPKAAAAPPVAEVAKPMKAARVKHVFNAHGVCTAIHDPASGVACGEPRKRKARAAASAAVGSAPEVDES